MTPQQKAYEAIYNVGYTDGVDAASIVIGGMADNPNVANLTGPEVLRWAAQCLQSINKKDAA